MEPSLPPQYLFGPMHIPVKPEVMFGVNITNGIDETVESFSANS
jgi:hypothetical protein